MTLRTIPVDPHRVQLVAAVPAATAVSEWAELADGSRRPSGNQAREKREDGTFGDPLWQVDCLVAGEDRGTLISVQIASGDEPKVQQFAPVAFEGLVARCSVGRADGKLRQYWSATGVQQPGKGGHQPKPEHQG